MHNSHAVRLDLSRMVPVNKHKMHHEPRPAPSSSASHLNSLNLSFLICKMGFIISAPSFPHLSNTLLAAVGTAASKWREGKQKQMNTGVSTMERTGPRRQSAGRGILSGDGTGMSPGRGHSQCQDRSVTRTARSRAAGSEEQG